MLLAEDNLVNQEVALAMLENLGLGYETVGNGADVLEILERQQFDLVADGLPDADHGWLPGHPGHPRSRTGAARPHLPVIALTANAVAGDRERCLHAGMDDYLAKPFTQEQLTTLLSRWLPAEDLPPAPVEAAIAPREEESGELLDQRALAFSACCAPACCCAYWMSGSKSHRNCWPSCNGHSNNRITRGCGVPPTH